MSWPSPRPTLRNLNTHQTFLGKTLFEHGDVVLVVTVAASSPSFLNSSLGPNLAHLIAVDEDTCDLFSKVFTFRKQNSTLQFAQSLTFFANENHHRRGSFFRSWSNRTNNQLFISELLNFFQQSLYGAYSLRKLTMNSVSPNALSVLRKQPQKGCDDDFSALETFKWTFGGGTVDRDRHCVVSAFQSLPNLTALTLASEDYLDGGFFDDLVALRNDHPNSYDKIRSFDLSSIQGHCHLTFQAQFCNEFLSCNSNLTRLRLNTHLDDEDCHFLAHIVIPNLVECEGLPAVCFDRSCCGQSSTLQGGEYFTLKHMRKVQVPVGYFFDDSSGRMTVSDDLLVTIGTRCPNLAELIVEEPETDSDDDDEDQRNSYVSGCRLHKTFNGSFLSYGKICAAKGNSFAFKKLKALRVFGRCSLSMGEIEDGFSRMEALEELEVVVVSGDDHHDGKDNASNLKSMLLQHLPNLNLLKKVRVGWQQ